MNKLINVVINKVTILCNSYIKKYLKYLSSTVNILQR